MDATTRQLHLEEEMRDLGVQRFRNTWNADRSRGDVGRQTSVRELIASQIEPTADAIRDAIDRAVTGRAMRKAGVFAFIRHLEPEVLAYLTARAVINGVVVKSAYATIQRELGAAIEDELRISKLSEHDKSATDWVEREVKRRSIQARHMIRGYYLKMEKHRGSPHRPWTKEEKIKVGAALCELFCKATRVVKVELKRSGKKTKAFLQPIEQIHHWISARNDVLELLTPDHLPMVVKPRAWSPELTEGGYLSYRVPLVKGTDEELRTGHLEALRRSDTTEVRAAVHTMDVTPYRINVEVLGIMRDLSDHGLVIPGLENTEIREIPEKPADIETNEDSRRDYRKQAREAHDHNHTAASLRLTFERVIVLGTRFANEPRLYFPSQLDFRGRAYPMPASLNPQGPDFARALLEFADAKPLGDRGRFWLKVNLANLYGEDKMSLEDRALWADSHMSEICDVARNPHGVFAKWWKAADKPWQFLAACIDYLRSFQTGLSSIRVSMDGSCNGIQHFAAMLLDPVAAKAVNLAPNKVPADIYQDVADLVISNLKRERDPQKKHWADTFRSLGIDRKITKRAVMVMPYGGTFKSTMDYVNDECRSRGYHEAFGDDWLKANAYLAKLVYDGTRTVVASGAEVMSWLQEVADIATKNRVHLRWTTPTGFVAEQHYVKYRQKNVQTWLDGKCVRQTTDYDPTGRIDGPRSRNGISPNYVHSMDAAAMMMAVNRARARDVTSFHCIHDDFGTHAGDTEILFHELRWAFVDIYRSDRLHKLYKEFCAQVPDFIPRPPARGNFDIRDVLKSEFFFC